MKIPPPLNESFSFSFTQIELTRAHRFHIRSALFTLKNLGLYGIALTLLFAQTLILPHSWTGLFQGMIALSQIGLGFWIFFWIPKVRIPNQPQWRDLQQIKMDSDGLTRNQEFYPWEDLESYRVWDRFHFLKFHQVQIPVILPERALPQKLWGNELENRIRRAGPSEKADL